MSLIPSSWDPLNSWYGMAPSRLLGQDFGVGLDDLMSPMGMSRGWMDPFGRYDTLMAPTEVVNEKNKFTVNVDCSHFRPEEIEVKTINDRLVINAKHEDRMDPHGYVSRSFTRQYTMPKEVELNTINSHFSPGGILTVEARKKAIAGSNERIIPITVGPRKPEIQAPTK